MRSTLPTFNEVWQRQCRSSILKQVQQFAEPRQFLIGCSGGMDSMLLLHLMSTLFPRQIRAIYIDHQLQDVSASWGDFVRAQCADLDIPCIVQTVTVAAGNLENQARIARYQAYQLHLQSDEILVLGHHQQDQAEIVFLRLLSGSGIHGLSAMKMMDQRNDFTIFRPLLDVSRQHIEAWVKALDIAYIQDPTNSDIQYDRAWCREQLWPILENRFPKMQQAVARTTMLMQDAEEILSEIVEKDLTQCGNQHALNLAQLAQLSIARQRQLLSAWVKGDEQYRPAFAMIERIQTEVIAAKADAQAALHIAGFYYVRYQNILYKVAKSEYLSEHQANIETTCIRLLLNQKIEIQAGCFLIQPEKVGLSLDLLGRDLNLSPRIGGEKIHLYGRVGRWPLKKAIQEAQIFPWQRHRIQILSIDDVMLGIFTVKGFWLAQSAYCEVGGWQPKYIDLPQH